MCFRVGFRVGGGGGGGGRGPPFFFGILKVFVHVSVS